MTDEKWRNYGFNTAKLSETVQFLEVHPMIQGLRIPAVTNSLINSGKMDKRVTRIDTKLARKDEKYLAWLNLDLIAKEKK